MIDDELEPRKKPVKPLNLENLSVEELERLVEDLETESIRIKAEIAKKKAYAATAASFFKTK